MVTLIQFVVLKHHSRSCYWSLASWETGRRYHIICGEMAPEGVGRISGEEASNSVNGLFCVGNVTCTIVTLGELNHGMGECCEIGFLIIDGMMGQRL